METTTDFYQIAMVHVESDELLTVEMNDGTTFVVRGEEQANQFLDWYHAEYRKWYNGCVEVDL